MGGSQSSLNSAVNLVSAGIAWIADEIGMPPILGWGNAKRRIAKYFRREHINIIAPTKSFAR